MSLFVFGGEEKPEKNSYKIVSTSSLPKQEHIVNSAHF